jgi:hypothetical protein
MAIRASRKLSSGHEAVNASVGGEFNGDWRARYPRWSVRFTQAVIPDLGASINGRAGPYPK